MINLDRCRKGGYGRYAKIGKFGYKFIGDGFKTRQECVKSRDFYSALKEATYLKIAEPSKISPKFISIDIVNIRKKYYPVVKMEHIKGKTLIRSIDFDSLHQCRVKSKKIKLNHGIRVTIYIRNKLKRLKVVHEDLHTNNIIIMPDKSVRVIDFGATTTIYLGNKKLFLKILHEIRVNYLKSIL